MLHTTRWHHDAEVDIHHSVVATAMEWCNNSKILYDAHTNWPSESWTFYFNDSKDAEVFVLKFNSVIIKGD